MEPSRQKLSDLLHGSALPPPPGRRALVFGTIAAIVAACAGGMASFTHELRVAHLTPGIGVLVGLAIVRARGYGTRLTIFAGAGTLVSIAGAYLLNYRLVTLSRGTETAYAALANLSFLEYLQETVGATDLAFGLIAVLVAAGLIHLRTSKLEQRARQKAIAERK